jgi:uncharacterized protein YdeI (BOF family)
MLYFIVNKKQEVLMKKLLALTLIAIMIMAIPFEVQARRRGRKNGLSITKLVENIKQYRGKLVTIKGTIVDQDTQGYGFWFVLSDGKEKIKVDIIKHQIGFYHHKMGKEAEIRGKVEYRFGEWVIAAKKYVKVDNQVFRPGNSIFSISEF